jgi:ferritin-like metal-binding protein YciE
LEELFTRTVRNLFSAGTQIARILPRIATRTGHVGLQTTLDELYSLTNSQLARLELVSKRHGVPLTEKGAPGMRGLIGEIEDTLAADGVNPFLIDLSLINLVRKAEHYRLVAVRSARAQAAALGWSHARATMDVILDEGEEIESALSGWIRELGATAGSARTGKSCYPLNAGRRSRATALLPGD